MDELCKITLFPDYIKITFFWETLSKTCSDFDLDKMSRIKLLGY